MLGGIGIDKRGGAVRPMEPYPNPPIREALVDIKIEPLPSSSLELLGALHEKIRTGYPTKKTRHRWMGVVETKEDRLVSSAQQYLGTDGFLFVSSDERQVVQFRLDGFTFNRLRPYPRQGWPVVREEASRLWDLYAKATNPARVSRIGLRYINEISIPGGPVALEDYLAEPPRIPSALPQTLEQFLSRLVIPFPDLDAKVIVTQSLALPRTPATTTLILDIDVLTETPMKADTPAVWRILDRFREVKNTVFKSSLTSKAEELFR